ncbi:hypothetical protein B0J11DRAFT_525947 [Dendryphion nanum]|uniref:Uncharacterized protein n=1 Tax=Dendryphion nanum TaxID=256645 RepID=A0A9P9DWJ6_9PLEO|nr:hypothetical protein B0J11DRAFT_525947 [Dendryphion nanum]
MTMPSLLTLPRELIQEIIYYSLLPPYSRPRNTSTRQNELEWILSGSARRSGRHRKNDDPAEMRYYSLLPVFPLLATCRHLQRETEEVWRRIGDSLPCHAEIQANVHGDLWARWTSIPKPMLTKEEWKISQLEARLSFFGHLVDEDIDVNLVARRISSLVHHFVAYTHHHGPGPEPPPRPRQIGRRRVGAKKPRKYRPKGFNAVSLVFETPSLVNHKVKDTMLAVLAATVKHLMPDIVGYYEDEPNWREPRLSHGTSENHDFIVNHMPRHEFYIDEDLVYVFLSHDEDGKPNFRWSGECFGYGKGSLMGSDET